jgi:cation diffusion facilitator CzcD-associated flavoprotein CzcO
VLANGREGLAQPRIPRELKTLSSKRVFHSSSKINFSSFKGKNVVVVGVAASALDNAACAAEAGATVTVVARSPKMPLLNKMRQTVFPGFAEGFYSLSDTEKLEWITHIQNQRIAPPKHTVERVAKLKIKLMLDSKIESAIETKTNLELNISSSKVKKVVYADFIILGTGFVIDLNQVPELRKLSKDILLWGDVLKGSPNESITTNELLSFPYLGPNFQFKSIEPSKNKILCNIRCFNHAAQLSLGNLANDVPHTNEGAQRLAKSIAADLFKEDKKVHFERLKNYTELEISGSEWSEIPD